MCSESVNLLDTILNLDRANNQAQAPLLSMLVIARLYIIKLFFDALLFIVFPRFEFDTAIKHSLFIQSLVWAPPPGRIFKKHIISAH